MFRLSYFSNDFQPFFYVCPVTQEEDKKNPLKIGLCIAVGNLEEIDLALVLLAAAVGALNCKLIVMRVSITINVASFMSRCVQVKLL